LTTTTLPIEFVVYYVIGTTQRSRRWETAIQRCCKGWLITLQEIEARRIAEELWSEIETHAGYSFNRSHAVAYAVVSYQCAWLKCKYPVAFMCALLNEKRDVQEKLREVCAEVRRMGIPFLGADVRYSGAEYRAEDNGIRIGLTGLVDFGQVAYDELQRVMHEGAPRSLDEFVRRANRAKLNTKSMTALINAGALGYLGDRATLKRELPLAIEAKIEAQHEARLEYVRGHNLTLAGEPRKRPWRALQASEALQVG
jgi:DNA polymerase III alpha subunit